MVIYCHDVRVRVPMTHSLQRLGAPDLGRKLYYRIYGRAAVKQPPPVDEEDEAWSTPKLHFPKGTRP